MTIAVLGQGTRGDLYPLLGIGRELVGTGHDVVVFEFEEYRSDVEVAGLRFVPVGPGSQCGEVFELVPKLDHRTDKSWEIDRLYFEASVRSARDFVRVVLNDSSGIEAFLGPAHHLGARIVSEITSLPLYEVLLGPAQVERYLPSCPTPNRRRLERVRDRLVSPLIREQRAYFGLPASTLRDSLMPLENTQHLVLSPPTLLDHLTLTPEFVMAGYPQYFGSGNLSPQVRAFVDDGTAPLVVCTVGDGWAGDLPQPFGELRAMAREGEVRVIYASGRASQGESEPGCIVALSENLQSLVGHASLLVSHGGMGAISTALRSKVPSVMLPQWPDGIRNSQVMHQCGLGTNIGSSPTPGLMKRAAREALNSDRLSHNLGVASSSIEKAVGAGDALIELLGAAARTSRPGT